MVVRRAVAVFLTLPLLALLLAGVTFGAASATVLSGDYLADAMEDTDFHHRVHAEGLPALVQEVVDHQEERLPDNLQGMNLPRDPESVARLTEVLQTMFPEDLVQQQTDEFLREFVPWITGRRGSFEWQVSLHDPLLATFAPRGTQPSLFEAAWLDLDMSHRLLQGLSERQARERAQPGAAAPEEPSILDQLGQDLPAAEAWTDDALFEVIDSMVPYLAGQAEDFNIHIDFTPYPQLAEPLSGMLRSDEATLLAEGWRFDSAELRQKFQESDNVAVNDPEQSIAIFRPGGATFTSGDFVERMEAQRLERIDAGEADTGPSLTEVRTALRVVRIAGSWLPILLALLLATAIGFLGGYDRRTRLLWGAGALAVVAAIALGATSTVYAATIEDRVDTWAAEERLGEDSDLPVALRGPVLDLSLEVTHSISAAMTWRAAAWLILGLVVVALVLAWPRLRPGPAVTAAPSAPSEPPPPEA